MHGRLKYAAELASSTGASAASPIPTPTVEPQFAPGKKGPAGLSPRTNYSRVNTGEIPAPDAGAADQKSMPPRGAEMLPKLAGEGLMGKMAGRPTLQDLVKNAMVESAGRVRVSEEARAQAEKMGEAPIKTASAQHDGTAKVAGQHVEKLASALDFLADGLLKGASLGGAYTLHEGTAGAAPPPGVSAASASTPLPDKKGEGVHTVPMHPGTQKAMPQEHGGTQLENNLAHAPGGKEKMVQKNAGVVGLIRQKLASQKTAAEEAEKKETEGLAEAKKGVEKAEKAHESEEENKKASALVDYMLSKTKKAEDAINPAQISAGAAVPPETSASGESGGQPAGGAPQGPTGLVGSNESAQNYTRGQAYQNRKADLGKYWNEPAMSAQHDHTLQDAFAHTGQAGPKIASAQNTSAPAESVKTAAARALLMNIAKAAEAEVKAKENGGAAA